MDAHQPLDGLQLAIDKGDILQIQRDAFRSPYRDVKVSAAPAKDPVPHQIVLEPVNGHPVRAISADPQAGQVMEHDLTGAKLAVGEAIEDEDGKYPAEKDHGRGHEVKTGVHVNRNDERQSNRGAASHSFSPSESSHGEFVLIEDA